MRIFSFDTGAFYNDEEYLLVCQINKLKYEASVIEKELKILSKNLRGKLSKSLLIQQIKTLRKQSERFLSKDNNYARLSDEEKVRIIVNGEKFSYKVEAPAIDNIEIFNELAEDGLNEKLTVLKEKISKMQKELVELIKTNRNVRFLRQNSLEQKNVISIFDSALTRTLGMKVDHLSEEIMIVKVYYFDVARDIALNGFFHNNEKYIYFASSAGQIRTKKMVFIKESSWLKHKNTLMCGISVDRINEMGGINRNKFLAYLSLCNSATDQWEDFDIDKAIVVEDLATRVVGEVDFFDDKTYEIKRQIMEVPIVHTDGCGIILPSLCEKNRMVRPPWIKGVLSPFDFREFVVKHNGNPKIKDIYGKEYDIFDDDIQIIFTKSQFKLWKYYKSWDEYKDNYRKYNCSTGYCNEEPDDIPYSKTNYQMLQTLTDITDDELRNLASKTNFKINSVTSDIDTVKEVFGADEINEESTYLQQAINLYPEILSDVYCKEKIKTLKSSLVKNARAGKLNIEAKYTFVIPDLYAFCEYLFLGDTNPRGLLGNGEVFCSLFRNSKELDCLRSPSLYREHAIRINSYDEIKSQWFTTKGIYVSCHDLISKILQCDWDGDKLLVSSEKLLIDVAKRNMEGVVPLYYEMASANADIIDETKIFEGLCLAFTSGNIGSPSNDITKEWNSNNPNIELIKVLTAEVNFTIDTAKTLYKPKRTKEFALKVKHLSSCKVPYFFRYAKDKKISQVENKNNSVINRLGNMICAGRLKYDFDEYEFDYRMLMNDSKRKTDTSTRDKICKVYDVFRMHRYNLSANTNQAIDKRNLYFEERRRLFIKYFADIDVIVDVLIEHLYNSHKKQESSPHKDILWYCFGDVIVDNLHKNLDNKYYSCKNCNSKFYAEHWNQKLCKKCSTYNPLDLKILTCKDCGKKFEISGSVKNKKRCDECQKQHTRRLKTRKQNLYRKTQNK